MVLSTSHPLPSSFRHHRFLLSLEKSAGDKVSSFFLGSGKASSLSVKQMEGGGEKYPKLALDFGRCVLVEPEAAIAVSLFKGGERWGFQLKDVGGMVGARRT